MEVKTNWNGGSAIDTINNVSTSEIMKTACRHLLEVEAPNTVTINAGNYGTVTLSLMKRGDYIGKDGYHHPSMHVSSASGNICVPGRPGEYKEAYLTCINANEIKDPTPTEKKRAGADGKVYANNYKFYRICPPDGNGLIVASYGPIGSYNGPVGNFGSPRKVEYDDPLYFWILYYEKLSKGYKDESKFYLNQKPVATKASVVAKTSAADRLFKQLSAFSGRYVAANTTIADNSLTEALVTEARKRWEKMCQRKTLKGFNNALLSLMELSPRPRSKVSDFLAADKEDIKRVVDREESLLLAMEGSVFGNSSVKNNAEGFEKRGIKVFEATDKQKEQVLRHITGANADVYKKNIVNIYRVIDERQQEKFNACLKARGLKNRDVKMFWHGSGNQNWLSIMVNKLRTNPGTLCGGSTHGKMLGNGNYFAPGLNKAAGYTSKQGSYWAHGNSNTSFAGLYAVAYGKPCIVAQGQNPLKPYTQSELDRLGYNCVHALSGAGGWLRNEEVCVFGDDAVLLNYLVEFKEGGSV